MYAIRRGSERGNADHGWLQSWHTFSFADYRDPRFMGFRTLRVINEDRIASGRGFATHPHRNMEIITYVISGSLEHKDSMGNTATILPDEVQTMSAGTGVKHSEYNPRDNAETHLLQIWIVPEQLGLTPSYGQKSFAERLKKENFVLVVSRDGVDGSIAIHQDVNIYVGRLKAQDEIRCKLGTGRHAWLQVVKGQVASGGQVLAGGDAAAVSDELEIKIRAEAEAEFLLFDLS